MWLDLVVWYPSTSQYSVFHHVNSAITYVFVLSTPGFFSDTLPVLNMAIMLVRVILLALCHWLQFFLPLATIVTLLLICLDPEGTGSVIFNMNALACLVIAFVLLVTSLMFASSHLGYSFVSVSHFLISFQLWCLRLGLAGHTSFSDRPIYGHSYLWHFYCADCAWVYRWTCEYHCPFVSSGSI